MLFKSTYRSIVTSLILMTGMLQNVAATEQVEPIDYLIKFEITGNFTGLSQYGSPVFTIGGPGYTTINTSSGQVLDSKIPGLQRASLSNAQITFVQSQANDPAYVSRFTCISENGGCRIELPDGSVLEADPEVALDGRLVGGTDQLGNPSPWGFIPNDKFDPQTGVFPQRILGCGGLRGVAGPLVGTVGAICFNGTFNVPVGPTGIDVNRPLTGGSNCTISMHHPTFPGQ
jgi:hypothetical protein